MEKRIPEVRNADWLSMIIIQFIILPKNCFMLKVNKCQPSTVPAHEEKSKWEKN